MNEINRETVQIIFDSGYEFGFIQGVKSSITVSNIKLKELVDGLEPTKKIDEIKLGITLPSGQDLTPESFSKITN